MFSSEYRVSSASLQIVAFLECYPSVLHSPDLYILHNEIFMRGEGWATEGGTGKAGAAVQISIQPQAESTPVDREAQETVLLSKFW